MASLGSFLLLATFVVCAYSAVISVAGARRGSRRLIAVAALEMALAHLGHRFDSGAGVAAVARHIAERG